LLEITLSSTLLLVGLGLVFGLFQWGSRSFLLIHLRSGLQTECRRVMAAIGPDLRRSDIHLVDVVDSTVDPARRVFSNLEGEFGQRHALSFANLSRWDDVSLIDSAECLPLWDRYTVIYATRSDPGRLIRQHHTPTGAPYSQPLGNLIGLIQDDPATNPGASRPLVLSSSVLNFEVHIDRDKALVTLQLTLAGTGSLKSGRRQMRERCQTRFTARLENSGPY
jgi:hypothetical protein